MTAKCPVRVDVAGGWSDTPPITYEHGGAVLNVAITVDGQVHMRNIHSGPKLTHQSNVILLTYKRMPYQNTLFLANLESLKHRQIKLSQSFFKKILSTNSCLHTLLPPECNNEVLSKLRKPLKYPVSYSRTKRCQPFLNCTLAHFQNNK